MEQVTTDVVLPKYARIHYGYVNWKIIITLPVSADVMNYMTSDMRQRGCNIPIPMFFEKRNKYYYKESMKFDYTPDGLKSASTEAEKLLRRMQKNILLAKMHILDDKYDALAACDIELNEPEYE